MKLFTHEEAQTYYHSLLRWGSLGGLAGLSGGLLVVSALNRFYPTFRAFTPSIKGSLALYPGILGTAAGANHAAHLFKHHQHPDIEYTDTTEQIYKHLRHREAPSQQIKELTYEHRYILCAGTWAATMMITLGLLRRDSLMTQTQKLVQARVVAQASTILILLLTTVMELRDVSAGRGKYEEVMVVAPGDPRYQHLKRIRFEPNLMETKSD
ncbi:HIG1 domain-containing protein [Aspergillus thermomutatus]|uniref:HIG1 domain-containing protein n=1 Tax=Aspergillus thermomutatus TaxID=41047 RepID=A0A397HNE5_ASPTH|nr:uncharacterized protein CDV56_100814 [Aspergillus thermomutatus]RHZ61980.1 hypothetical protein CDV56_100814 [Aspergillus thermomutatus]